MSKYRMYIDIYEGLDPKQYGLGATTQPGKLYKGSKRIAFDVTIPDEIMFDITGYASEVSKVEVVSEEDE